MLCSRLCQKLSKRRQGYIAALQGVPDTLYEAAMVDGVGLIRRFFRITLPLIVPAITVNVTLYLGWGLRTSCILRPRLISSTMVVGVPASQSPSRE